MRIARPVVLISGASRCRTGDNCAERGLRHAVISPKISFGNNGAKGEVATARPLTVARICVMRQRNPLEFLGDSIGRHRAAQPSLSLLQR